MYLIPMTFSPYSDVHFVEEIIAVSQVSDLCDKCGAPGMVKFIHKRHITELVFCGHHAEENLPALIAKGFVVVGDNRKD